MPRRHALIQTRQGNAAIAWTIVGAIVIAAVATLLQGSVLWTALATAIAVIAAVPAIVRANPQFAPPWEVLGLAAIPIWVRLFAPFPIAGFLTVATIALLVTVELDAFTPIEMSARFSVAFVVLATMAVAGLWVIAQWLSDFLFATTFLTSTSEVMWDLVLATAFGGLAAVLFAVYFYRTDDNGVETNTPAGDPS